ncbi:MAG: hypothetical protein CMF94_00655 [Candidatus Marinimicrobia bacterium]|nr:hypothetical protein [Candidatus Neomarinimicrobiota bacterium]
MKKFGPEYLSQLKPRSFSVRYVLTYVSFLLCSTLAKTKVMGRWHVPLKGPFVVASNHFSNYDPPFFKYGIKKPINFIAASDQEVDWWLIWAPFLYGWIPVDRKKLAPSTIKRALNALKENEILGIFPDGGVNETILGNPKNGTVYLSTIGKAPIVPMAIYGAEKAIENLLNGVRPRVSVNIGKPFGPFSINGSKKKKDEKLRKIGSDMMVRIASLLPKERQGPYVNNKNIEKYQIENGFIPKP